MTEFNCISKQESKGVRKIRRNRFIALTMMFLFVPICGFIGDMEISEAITGAFAFSYFLVTIILLGIVSFSRCPRCSKFFFWSWFWANGFTRKCVHCGLSIKAKYENKWPDA